MRAPLTSRATVEKRSNQYGHEVGTACSHATILEPVMSRTGAYVRFTRLGRRAHILNSYLAKIPAVGAKVSISSEVV